MRVHIYETLQKLGMMMQNGSLNCLAVKNFNLKNLKGQTAAILKSKNHDISRCRAVSQANRPSAILVFKINF